MKKNITGNWFFFAVVTLLLLSGCEKEGNEGNQTNISTYQSAKSHNTGKNCMECHVSGGSGEGWFNAAGTVYDSTKTTVYPGATVRLYSGPGGTGNIKATIQVDANGNFYTTENIDFGNGLYPSVEGNKLKKYMGSSITAGACNGCHGATTDHIWTK